MLKVVLFTDADVFAGTEQHMLGLADGLSEQDVDVAIACPRPSALAERCDEIGIRVVPIDKGGLVDWAAVRKLRRLLRSGRYDIIHAHNGRTAFSGAIAVRLARRGALIATQHFLEPNHLNDRGLKAVLSQIAHRWVAHVARKFVAISQAVRAAMSERGETSPEHIVVIPNGISDPLPKVSTAPAEVRREWGVEADAPMVVCVARLEREKDIRTLVEAMSQVVRQVPRARCLLAGEGSLQGQIERQISQNGLGEAVRLLGFVPDASTIMSAADVFVLPSLAEPFGLVIIEAMAMARPVIATRAGGAAEIVVDQQTGLLVPPSSPDEMSRAIVSLLNHPERARALGEAGRQRFLNTYTQRRMVDEMLQLYRQAL